MKNIVYAFIISILIHFLFLLSYQGKENTKPSEKMDKNKQTQTIRYVKLKPKAVANKAVEPKKVDPVFEPFLKNLKKVEPKKLKKAPKREVVKKPKRTVIEKTKKITPKKVEYKKAVTKKTPTKQTRKVVKVPDNRFDYLYEKEEKSLEQSAQKAKKQVLDSYLATPGIGSDMVDSVTQEYLDVYGEEFDTFTKVQKVFLKKNIKNIRWIYQSYLNRTPYHYASRRMGKGGVNIMEFMLYPNGDIGNILLTNSSGQNDLDKNSIRGVELTFKDFPRPKEPTKIKIQVTYIIRR